MGKRIVVVSDLHVGSTVGLWPESAEVQDGGVYTPSRYQRWLLECWQDMLAHVAKMRPRPLLVLNGDVLQGVNSRDGQLVTNQWHKQAEAAEALLRPLVASCSGVYYIRGTEWHEGPSSDHVEGLAKSLGARRKTTSAHYTHQDLYLDLGGDVIHFAHSIGVSSVAWYEATVPLRELLMLSAELHRFFGKDAPDLRMVVRSHRHRFIHVDAPPDLHVVVSPAWQLVTAFAAKKGIAMLPQIGYVVIEAGQSGLMVDKRIYPLVAPRVEVI